jgi:hypothetical protein
MANARQLDPTAVASRPPVLLNFPIFLLDNLCFFLHHLLADSDRQPEQESMSCAQFIFGQTGYELPALRFLTDPICPPLFCFARADPNHHARIMYERSQQFLFPVVASSQPSRALRFETFGHFKISAARHPETFGHFNNSMRTTQKAPPFQYLC